MRKLLLQTLAAAAAMVGSASAQDCCLNGPSSPSRIYGSAEYLRVWLKDAPIEFPLLTTGPAATGTGVIGAPGTTVLFGNEDVNYDEFNGGRVTLGYWLNDCATVGIEGSGFLLEEKTTISSFRSNAAGAPLLAFPIIDPSIPGNNALIVSDPTPAGITTGVVGGASFASRVQLWGAESNLVVNLGRSCNASLDALLGARYLDLDEEFRIQGDSRITAGPTVVGGANLAFEDRFDTRNQFYGGQVGLRARVRSDRLSYSLIGKCAFGWNDQVVDVNGRSTVATTGVLTGAFPATVAGGLYTQPSNIGRREDDQFAIVPEAIAEVGYHVSDNVKLTAGYNLLYWTEVVRPGGTIDPRVNSTTSNFAVNPRAGAVAPQPRSDRDDFWMHGFHAGIAINY